MLPRDEMELRAYIAECLKEYLKLAGGTLTGQLNTNKGFSLFKEGANWGTDRWDSISSDTSGFCINARNAGKNRQFYFNSNAQEIKNALRLWYYDDGTERQSRFFGDHNKPTGSYTGNGDATSRTIDTGGIGSNVIITGQIKGFVIVNGEAGAFHFPDASSSGGNVTPKYYPNSEISFSDGILKLATTADCVNKDGLTFYYRVF